MGPIACQNPIGMGCHFLLQHIYVYTHICVCVCVCCHFSRVRFFATLWTVARQAPMSTGFSRQAYWSGLPCPPPGEYPYPGIKPLSLTSPALAGGLFTSSAISVLHTHIIVSNAIFYGELCVLLICLLSSQLSNLHLWGRPPLQ